jgi:hypothetical protein
VHGDPLGYTQQTPPRIKNEMTRERRSYRGVVCALVLDEPPQWVAEWAAFHAEQGFHVAIYDHHSAVPMTLSSGSLADTVIGPFPEAAATHWRCGALSNHSHSIRAGLCSTLDACASYTASRNKSAASRFSQIVCHHAAYADCLHRFGPKTAWIGNWDSDEFVFPCEAAPAPPIGRMAIAPAEPARLPASTVNSVMDVGEMANVSSLNLECLTFGPRTATGGTGRLRTHLWRAPDKLFGEAARCSASSPSLCAEALEKRLSVASAVVRMGVHHHSLKRGSAPSLTRQRTRAAGVCCHHYRFADMEHIRRKAVNNHDPHIVAQMEAGVFASGGWFEQVFDDRILRWLGHGASATQPFTSNAAVNPRV